MNNLPVEQGHYFARNTYLPSCGQTAVFVGILIFSHQSGSKRMKKGCGDRHTNRGMETECVQSERGPGEVWVKQQQPRRRPTVTNFKIRPRAGVHGFPSALLCRRILSARTCVSPSVPGSSADIDSYNILLAALILQGAPVCMSAIWNISYPDFLVLYMSIRPSTHPSICPSIIHPFKQLIWCPVQ